MEPCQTPVAMVPTVVRLVEPAQVERAVFSTSGKPTAALLRVCQDLSPRQYCAVVPADMAGSLLLNVDQSVEVRYPFTRLVAAGIAIVRSADRSPPPVRGAEVLIVRDVPTLLLNVLQSEAESAPACEALAAWIPRAQIGRAHV